MQGQQEGGTAEEEDAVATAAAISLVLTSYIRATLDIPVLDHGIVRP